VVKRPPIGPVVAVGLLGDRQPGTIRLDQAEPDELVVLDRSKPVVIDLACDSGDAGAAG
jgi:hypothetical protein